MRTSLVLSVSLFLTSLAAGQTGLFTFNGNSSGDQLGSSVSCAGDANGDGFLDLVVGAPQGGNGFGAGFARVFSGVNGAVLYTFNGDSAQDFFGASVSGAGDVNGDGFLDLIVGAPGDDNSGSSSGSARVFSGATGAVLFTFNGDAASDVFGTSVSGAGDVNGDGFADLIVGADFGGLNVGGYARVLSGVDGSVLFTFNGDSAFDEFGISVAGAGDVNGDGFADLIVGAHLDSNNGGSSGSARVFSGIDGSVLFTFNGDSAGDEFGISVSGAGDVNGDGFSDLIVGAFGDDNNGQNSGSARVFSGVDGSLLMTFNGDAAQDMFGNSVSGAEDVNGDGFADLIVGARGDDNNGPGSGSARVFSGVNGSVLFTFNGDSGGDNFGFSVSGAGDVNGDGLADLIVGAFADDNTGNNSGSARVFSGQRDFTLSGPATALIGASLSYTLSALIPQPGTTYVFDVSLSGATPGIALPAPLNGPIPLNPPLLNLSFGPQLPGVFLGFSGILNVSGQAAPAVNIPNAPFLVGLTLSAAGITLDPSGPFGLGFVSNGVQTLIQ